MKIYKEKFDGNYDGVIPPLLLTKGSISDGRNVRKVSTAGGWKGRKGCQLLNTTAAGSGSAIQSMHQYTNPLHGDYHFILQCANDLLNSATAVGELLTEAGSIILQENGQSILSESQADPLDVGVLFDTSILASGVTVGGVPGFSAIVGEYFVYADGSGIPVIFGGDTPYCTGFVVYDASETAYVDYTREVTDGKQSTNAVLGSAAGDIYYVCSPEIADAIHLTFGTTVNTEASAATVKAWRSGAWAAVTGPSDGTEGTQTHDTDGTISWTRGADEMKVINGIMGYWYQVSFSAAISAVDVISCRVSFDATNITAKWDGTFQDPAGCLFYDQSEDEYDEVLGRVTTDSESTYIDLNAATTSDFIYIKTLEPATGFGFAIAQDQANDVAAVIDLLEYWSGNAWTGVATNLDDGTLNSAGTKSFTTTGRFWFDASAMTPKKRTWQGDSIPGYWYRISWDVALGTATQVYRVLYAAYPEDFEVFDGVTEFQGRAIFWGGSKYPNRLFYTPFDRPDVTTGNDAGYTTKSFGGAKSKIKLAMKLYEYIVVWKTDGVWLMDKDFNIEQVADKVGIGSPKTAVTLEIGLSGVSRDELVSVAIWQDSDGVYIFDGSKPKKVSGPVDHYFNPEYSGTAISPSNISNLQAFPDPANDEYHLLLPTQELVYNYKTDEWYPPWERSLPLVAGIDLKSPDGEDRIYAGSQGGFVMRIEYDTSDKDAGNADTIIIHEIKTRALAAAPDESTTFRFTFRKLWAELKARAAGTLTTILYKNRKSSGSTLTVPSALSLVGSNGEQTVVPSVHSSEENCYSIEFTFRSETMDQEMEIYSFLYEIDATGEIVF
jgi:hypothetical protein